MKLFNRKTTKTKRQELRNDMPRAEKILWGHLKKQQINDCKFRRQHGIGAYIVDFYCPEKQLVLEIDGDSHFEAAASRYELIVSLIEN